MLFNLQLIQEIQKMQNRKGCHRMTITANFNGVYLKEANLIRDKDNFIKANLIGANLEGADLEKTNLKGTNLREANLEGANIEGANIEGAKIKEAHYLTFEQLSKVKYK